MAEVKQRVTVVKYPGLNMNRIPPLLVGEPRFSLPIKDNLLPSKDRKAQALIRIPGLAKLFTLPPLRGVASTPVDDMPMVDADERECLA